jgi:hypothetical protein
VNDATATFREIDAGTHDTRVRQFIASVRDAIHAREQHLISSSLWKNVRAYLPNPHYDARHAMDWANTRPSFKELAVPAERIVIMPHVLPNFAGFFDAVGLAMVTVAERLAHV